MQVRSSANSEEEEVADACGRSLVGDDCDYFVRVVFATVGIPSHMLLFALIALCFPHERKEDSSSVLLILSAYMCNY